MKILKIFGIVAGVHVLALLVILANPGCSSTSKPAPSDTAAKTDPAPKVDPAPSIGLPGAAAAPADASAGITPAPVTPAGDQAPVIAAGLFSPTRPGTLAASALEAQPEADVTPATTYVVGKGDNLWIIAKKNHIRVSVLAKANGLGSASSLHIGQKLIIPAAAPAPEHAPAAQAKAAPAEPRPAVATPAARPQTYTVRPGDSLRSIARRLHVSQRELGLANNISDPQALHPGQVLTVPPPRGGGRPQAQAAAPTAVPAADQDLDAGLKPAASGQVPAIRLDESPVQPADAKP
jgi:LysM repeat protein